MKALVAAVYGFSAWMAAGLLVYAVSPRAGPRPAALRCAALASVFVPIFRLYFRRADSLPPLLAAVLTLALIAALDYVLLSPLFLHPYDLFLSFWDWQLPAGVVLLSILGPGFLSSNGKKDQQVRH